MSRASSPPPARVSGEAALAVLLVSSILSLGCRGPNPAFEGIAGPQQGDAAASIDGGGVPASDGPPISPSPSLDGGAGADSVAAACLTDEDGDGYGAGPGCPLPDCDDKNPAVTVSASRPCYSGAPNTAGVGLCRAGLAVCRAGLWTACSGEVTPSAESCNLADDDCNGTVDDGFGATTCQLGTCERPMPACSAGTALLCQAPPAPPNDPCGGGDQDCDGAVDEDCAACLRVVPGGRDLGADGSAQAPFGSIQAAIDFAVAQPMAPRTICVSAGPDCSRTHTYQQPAGRALTMADGISVLGSYESTNWRRCGALPNPGVLTPQVSIALATPEGVLFPSTVRNLTVLDSIRLDRDDAATTAAVTVDGGRNVRLTRVLVDDTPDVETSYAVNVINGGEATIISSALQAGNGRKLAVGVRAAGARVVIRDSCRTFTNGRCSSGCGRMNELAVRGRLSPSAIGASFGVLLENAPESQILESAVCGNDAQTGAAIRLVGDGAGVVVRGSYVAGAGGDLESHGIWLEDCRKASPWIVNNELISASGDGLGAKVAGVRSVGDCHPVLDANALIAARAEGTIQSASGVHCGPNAAGASSRCVLQGNRRVVGATAGAPAIGAAVRCERGSCARLSGNTLEGGAGAETFGVSLEGTDTLLDANWIEGGCGTRASVGVLAAQASGRLQNNRVFGARCPGGTSAPSRSVGLEARGAAPLDVHSNLLDGGGGPGACRSVGVELSADAASPPGAFASFRSNILRGGSCGGARTGWSTTWPGAAARVLENNDFDPSGGSVLFQDGTTLGLAEINQRTGARANISADPRFVAYPTDLRLMGGSPCIDGGATAGAPGMDANRRTRDARPDIGPYEF